MKVNWKIQKNGSPILFSRRAEWTGFDIRHVRVLPGELIEQTHPVHKINITLEGSILAKRHTATGNWRTSRVGKGFVCLNPAGQPFKSIWESELEYLTIMLNPIFVGQTALELNFSADVELVEIYERRDPLIQHIASASFLFKQAEEFATCFLECSKIAAKGWRGEREIRVVRNGFLYF